MSSFSVWMAGNLGAFGINKIQYDVISYHGYFPALFIKKDLSLKFFKDSADTYSKKGMYWAHITKDNQAVLKTTYGLSLMNLPFTIWPYLFDKSLNTGYELPFSIAISVANLFYYILAFIILYKLLSGLRFSNFAIGLTILCIGLGTNALAYASVGIGMPHAYGIFLSSALLYLCLKWQATHAFKYTLLLGLVIGLLILIRPTNIIFALCFLLCKQAGSSFKFSDFFTRYLNHLLIIAGVAFLIVLPQLLYWKYTTGHYIFNSYVGERFYFDRPHVWQYLVGFRKGWFIYSPLILLSFIGLVYSRKVNPFFKATVIIIPLLIYLNSSWWCWWFGGSYGARAMIETYPLLAIGFVCFFDYVAAARKKTMAWVCSILILFNIKSVDLYRVNTIHFDGMTYKAFMYTSFKLFFSPEEKEYLKTLYQIPDYNKALAGEDT